MGSSTISWEQFGKLKDFRSVEEYLLGREYGHGKYEFAINVRIN